MMTIEKLKHFELFKKNAIIYCKIKMRKIGKLYFLCH